MPLSESESRCFVRLFATPRTIQSMEFSRPEYWNGYYAFNLFTCSSPQSMHVYVLGWPKKSVLFPVRCYLYVFMYIYTLKSMCVYIYTHTHTHTHTHIHVCVYLSICSMLSHFNCVPLSAALWIVVHQAPLSMGFSTQEYWSGLPWSSPVDLSDSGMEPESHISSIGRQVLYH